MASHERFGLIDGPCDLRKRETIMLMVVDNAATEHVSDDGLIAEIKRKHGSTSFLTSRRKEIASMQILLGPATGILRSGIDCSYWMYFSA